LERIPSQKEVRFASGSHETLRGEGMIIWALL
jgi:hypothetical protein